MQKTAKHVIFKGRVQGVGFRYTTQRAASRYGLTGFVKNLPDGTVEALFQGTDANITACMEEIADSLGGYIRDIIGNQRPVNPQYHDFRISY
ncbi:MAG: acylphosphatase [Planctomycetota bacterium]|jgi:acylphosphatase